MREMCQIHDKIEKAACSCFCFNKLKISSHLHYFLPSFIRANTILPRAGLFLLTKPINTHWCSGFIWHTSVPKRTPFLTKIHNNATPT